MPNPSELSDEELDRLIAAKSRPAADLSQLSDADLDAKIAAAQGGASKGSISPIPELGLMEHIRGALRSAAGERDPGLMRSFLELAAQPPGQGPLAAAVHRAGDVMPLAQQLAAGFQALGPQTYAEVRREQEARTAAGAEAHPTASAMGAGGAIIAQLGGPVAAGRLLAKVPGLARSLVSRGMLTTDMVKGALTAAGIGAGAGVALSDADIPLAEGNIVAAGERAFAAATDIPTLLLSATLGAAAGAKGANMERKAVEGVKRSETATQLKAYDDAQQAYPAQKEAAKSRQAMAKRSAEVDQALRQAEANAAARRVTPENAARVLGLDKVPGGTAASTKARATRMLVEKVPGSEESWIQARMRFGDDDIPGFQKFAEETRGRVGDALGDIRDAIAKTESATVNVPKLKEDLREAIGALPTEKAEASLSKVFGLLDDAAKGGTTVGAAKLRQVIRNLEEAKLWNLRRVAVDAEKRLVSQFAPERVGEYKQLLSQWQDANSLAQGAERQARAINRGTAPVRYDKATKVELEDTAAWGVPEAPAKPNFPGGAEGLKEARQILAPELTPKQQLAKQGLRSIGGAVGGYVMQQLGIPFGGYMGAAGGYQGMTALGNSWIKAVRPNLGGIMKEGPEALAALEKWGPQLQAAMVKGPVAVRSLHRALMGTDPDYREMMDGAGRTGPEPLSFGEFTGGFRRQQ